MSEPTRLTDLPRIREHIDRIVNDWPPLTEEQRAGIAWAFKGHTDALTETVARRAVASSDGPAAA